MGESETSQQAIAAEYRPPRAQSDGRRQSLPLFAEAASPNRGSHVSETDDQYAELATVHVERSGDHSRALLIGELDMSNAEEIYQRLLAVAEGSATVMVDLSRLAFIDSAGVAILDRLNRSLGEGTVKLRISAGKGSIAARTLALAGMDRILPMALDDSAG